VWVISGSNDNTTRVWDASTGHHLKTLNHNGGVNSLFFNDSTLWSASADRNIRSWDLRSGNQLHILTNGLHPVLKIEAGLGPHIITHDTNTVKVYDTRNTQAPAVISINTSGATTCAYYTSENRYAVGNSAGLLQVYNLNNGTTISSTQLHHQPITCLHAEGDCVVTGSADRTCKLWNIKSSSVVYTLQGHADGPVNSVQMDENRIVSGGSDMCLKVWNRANGNALYSLLGGSRQERGNNPAHPLKAGCSGLKFDRSRIVASFNSLLRVYSFEVSE